MLKKIYLYVFVVIGLIGLFIILNNKEEVQLVKEYNPDTAFAIMIRQDNGEYVQSENNTWPSAGYQYNSSKSGCVDTDGNVLTGALSYDSTKSLATFKTNITATCYLYFDPQ